MRHNQLVHQLGFNSHPGSTRAMNEGDAEASVWSERRGFTLFQPGTNVVWPVPVNQDQVRVV